MKNISENSPKYWKGFRIERMNESHYPAIVNLLNTTFRAKFKVDLLQKKYATEFLGAKNIAYIAFDGDLAVCYHIALLVALIHQGKTYLSTQSCDAATHPNYEKRGLWVALNHDVFAHFEKEKIAGIFGFPNQNTHPIVVNKLAYQEAEKLRHYQINIHKIPFGSIFRRLKLGKLIRQLALKSFKKHQIPPIPFSSFDDKTHLIVNRTPAYLAYKTKMGSFFIELHSTVFWIKIKNGSLFIGDLKTPSETFFDKAMTTLKSLCFWIGLKSIIFQTHTGSFEESLFALRYESSEVSPTTFRAFDDTIPFHLFKCTYADLDTF